jgi:hypothetical protein
VCVYVCVCVRAYVSHRARMNTVKYPRSRVPLIDIDSTFDYRSQLLEAKIICCRLSKKSYHLRCLSVMLICNM